MKLLRYGVAGVLILLAAGCGGQQNRAALAKQTVVTYWSDINHMKLGQAYNLLTPGNQQVQPKDQYEQSMQGFLSSTGGIIPTAGRAKIDGDEALVGVKLHSPKGADLKSCQHLHWESGKWLISEQNGGLANPSTCPKGLA